MKAKKQRIFVRDRGLCHYCLVECEPFGQPGDTRRPKAATIEHIQTRMSGGGNADENLTIACHSCNNKRNCIPYAIFVRDKLWLDDYRCRQMSRLFSIGAQVGKSDKQVYILELYYDDGEHIDVQNWGVFDSAHAVHTFIARQWPEAVHNDDDFDEGFVGYHFPEGHVLENVSFVANSWDLCT